MNNSHLINLVDGSTLLGEVVDETSEKLLLHYPFVVDITLREDGVPLMSFDKYLKFDIDNLPVSINKDKVISYHKATNDLDIYYNSVVKQFIDKYDSLLVRTFNFLIQPPKELESSNTYH